MFDQLPDLHFKLLVIIPKYSRIAESTYTRVIPLMMQFLVLKCVLTYTRGRLIHEYIRYLLSVHNINVTITQKNLILLKQEFSHDVFLQHLGSRNACRVSVDIY